MKKDTLIVILGIIVALTIGWAISESLKREEVARKLKIVKDCVCPNLRSIHSTLIHHA